MDRALRIARLAGIGVIGLVLYLGPESSAAKNPPKTGRAIVQTNPEAFGPIADRIHFTAADVPAFPMDDRRLADPSAWPETMVIGGEKAVRKIWGWDEYVGSELPSVKKRRSNMRLVLSYSKVDAGDDDAATVGPRYSWNARGQLAERIYYEPTGNRLVTHDYTYSRDGSLLGYSWRSEARNPEHRPGDSEYLSEFYDADGQLVALAYEKKLEGETVSIYSWNGENLPFDEFRMKSHVLYANAAR